MAVDILASFIGRVSYDPASAWDEKTILELATSPFPSEMLGDKESLLRGDQHRLWLRWYLEGLISPQRIAGLNPPLDRLDVYQLIADRIKLLHADTDPHSLKPLVDNITEHLWSEVERLRLTKVRDTASIATKKALLASTSLPRCYICGYEFSNEAIDALLRVKGRSSVKLPAMVDVLQPRGLIGRDVGIEIEHVVPVASGGHGQANLRLSCGWCNRYKSSRLSLYEATFVPPQVSRFSVGVHHLHELPHPFWTIRLLAFKKRCQHKDGCTHTAQTSEMVIALKDWKGSPNPTNLAVFCKLHDPIRLDRHQPIAEVKKIWEERR
ncbi:HNH endonuclease [Agrobacterium larrymoorei]|uniref:HNH endonuclease n=1 Tax=Agrobacterium larrymoorei TaxID=160699 RepID=A0A4D7DTV5_9HYPH|nr:hypothetical protein [Agrobacterium larrymoorei]QCJ00896.1 hypothetical protein CFBP5473_23135 [Agrobacterium larrymoorei]QYA10232.1 hypothetical protein J5285_23805 [Agrobacterium larrymoorei]